MDAEAKACWSGEVNGFSRARIVDKANDLLIYRKFENCLNVCHSGLAEARNFPETDRSEIWS